MKNIHVIIQILITTLFTLSLCKRHNISLKDDGRKNFPLSTFGFFSGGKLLVDIVNFSYGDPYKIVKKDKDTLLTGNFGFSLQRTTTDGVSSYMEKASKKCLLEDPDTTAKDIKIVLFKFQLKNEEIEIETHGDKDFQLLKIDDEFIDKEKWSLYQWLHSHFSFVPHIIGLDTDGNACQNTSSQQTQGQVLKFKKGKEGGNFSGKFTVDIDCSAQAGLYNLYFHNCLNYQNPDAIRINLDLHMIELNENTFLSAGEIPLPVMYGFMSVGFFITACFWAYYLRRHWMWCYKVHWLMAVLVFIKSISVAFHAVNYYYTGKEGFRVQTWAVLYYVIHLLKGALLFTTIVLIGTGYFFMKHVLSSKEKKLFMIVIPLQVVANVALIISESTEEGNASYKKWYEITLLVDLLCCGGILLPIVWSIRHLSEAAKTDGKAAISLQKLKLFRQFYVIIVCYIYFTRIVVYLIKITVPYQFMWLDEFFTESATFFFFVLTGYKFRPVNNNPYLHLPQEEADDEIEMNDITQNGLTENLSRVNKTDIEARKT